MYVRIPSYTDSSSPTLVAYPYQENRLAKASLFLAEQVQLGELQMQNLSNQGSATTVVREPRFDELRYPDRVDREFLKLTTRFETHFEYGVPEDVEALFNRDKLDSLCSTYDLRNQEEILEYLNNHIFLVPFLLEIYGKILEYFPYPKITLRVITDSEEDDDGITQLEIFIYTNLDPDEAVDRLDEFDEGWWLDASLRANGKLSIHLGFV